MRGMVPPDPQSQVSSPHYAVVYVPKRSRKRFSAGCVEIVEDKQSALTQQNPAKNLYAAEVLGPSKSSEGQYLYYLLAWLDEDDAKE